MNLLPGYRLAVAPKFHLDTNWMVRLGISTGVENLDGKFFPRGPWRALTPEERERVVGPRSEQQGELVVLGRTPELERNPTPDAIFLFRIPEHLHRAWWALLDASAATGGPLTGFDEFAAQVSAFLSFKGLDPSGPTQMEALVTAPGERSIRRDPDTGRPSGLGSTLAPWTAWPRQLARAPRLHAVVNLGDEPSSVVVINLPPTELAAELERRDSGEPHPSGLAEGTSPTTVGELVERFLRVCSDYPTIRVQLGSAEGCSLPAGGLILDGDPTGKSEPDVLLLISAEAAVERKTIEG
jgi:hypothetical protein